jgi:hypothetical protein
VIFVAKFFAFIVALVMAIGIFTNSAYATTTLQVSPILLKYELDPGAKVNKTITATNKGDSTISITTDISDYTVNENGVPQFVKPSRNPLSAGNWMKVDTKGFVLKPGESKDVDLSIDVPKSATSGGHYGAVLFMLGGIDAQTGQVQVGVVGRMAALSLVTIKGPVNKKGYLDNLSVPLFSNAHPVPIELTYSNKGNVHLSTRGTLVVKNWLGTKVKSIPIPESYVMPGSKKTVKTAMRSSSLIGFYKMELSLKEKSIKNLPGPAYFIVFPWTIALGVILIVASIFLLGKRQGKKALKVAQEIANSNQEKDKEVA